VHPTRDARSKGRDLGGTSGSGASRCRASRSYAHTLGELRTVTTWVTLGGAGIKKLPARRVKPTWQRFQSPGLPGTDWIAALTALHHHGVAAHGAALQLKTLSVHTEGAVPAGPSRPARFGLRRPRAACTAARALAVVVRVRCDAAHLARLPPRAARTRCYLCSATLHAAPARARRALARPARHAHRMRCARLPRAPARTGESALRYSVQAGELYNSPALALAPLSLSSAQCSHGRRVAHTHAESVPAAQERAACCFHACCAHCCSALRDCLRDAFRVPALSLGAPHTGREVERPRSWGHERQRSKQVSRVSLVRAHARRTTDSHHLGHTGRCWWGSQAKLQHNTL
jgi:hypothetical protein